MKLDVMVTAWLESPHAYFFRRERGNAVTRFAAVLRPGGEKVHSPCLAYAIQHPSAGVILVDTGLHPDASTSLRKDYGLAMSLVFRSMTPADRSYEDQLRDLGIEPGEVEQVVMTHLHVDHTGAMRLLPRAEFITTRPEWDAAHARSAAAGGYAAGHLPPESRMRFVDFDSGGEPFGPFTRTIDLLGDGNVRLISTPGHSRGHLSVLVRTGEGQVLIVGDAVYTLRSLREEILPLITDDDDVYRRSLRELKAFAEQEPDAILVPTHDPDAWRALADVTARTGSA